MEKYLELVQKADNYFKTADHLAYVTYPLVKEPKLVLTILENISLALKNQTNALMEYERLYKRIAPMPEGLGSRIDMFAGRCLKRYNVPEEYLILIKNVENILEQHKKSPIEFGRGEKMVICSENFRTKTINLQDIKNYLNQTRDYISRLNRVLLRHE